MSYILDALKRAEQKVWQEKAPKSRTVEPAVELPAWEVKMVSPTRFERFRAGDTTEQQGKTDLYSSGRPSLRPGAPAGSEEPHPQAGTRAYSEVRRGERRSTPASGYPEGTHLKAYWYNALPKGVGVAAVILALLLLIECAVIYEVRGRMSTIATDVSKLTRQVSETEARIVKNEGERLDLKMGNDSLRQELEMTSADLARARDAVQKLKVKQQRVTSRKRQVRVTDQKGSAVAPLASAPPPPMGYGPPRAERASGRDAVEAANATVYSIR